MNYEQSFWAGTQDVRLCGDCNFRMTQLFSSFVCDRCNPPEASKSATTCAGGECPIPPSAVTRRYTYSSSGARDEISKGYKLYETFSYIIAKVEKKARKSNCDMFVYEVTESVEDYLDPSLRRPVTTRPVKVVQILQVSP